MALFCYPGQKDNTFILHRGDGFYYHLNKVRPNRRFAYLRCVHYGSAKYNCFGTAKVVLVHNRLHHLSAHSHDSNPSYLEELQLKRAVYARVKTGDQTAYNEIIQQEGQRYPLAVRARVAAGSILNRMNAIRSGLRPPVPESLEILGAYLLQPQYRYLTSCLHVPESLFAGVCGSLADQTLSLIFISSEMKAFMQRRRMIFADGTERRLFRKPKASQIFVIATAWRFHGIVMCRAIMLRRTQLAYEVLFNHLQHLMPEFHPRSIKCDFEVAQMNAWQNCFPGSQVEGCLWHFNVAIYSMAKKKLGLYHLVREEDEVASIIRSAGALPLLPSHEIEAGLRDLGYEAFEKGWMPQLKKFFQYMHKEWVPKAPILSVIGSIHRTNNVSESANRLLNREIKSTNPSVFDVLGAFVRTNEKYTVDKHTLALNLQPGRGRKISALMNDARIKRVTADYTHGEISRLQFLHSASRQMQGVFNHVYR